MDNNQIYINIHDDKVKVSYKKAMPMTDFLQIISTAVLSAMKQVVQLTPENLKQEVTEDLYDMYNAAASNTLNYFAPEIEMRPHLTTQAILEAENQLIEKQARTEKLKAVK